MIGFEPKLLQKVVQEFGTPAYVYAQDRIVKNFSAYKNALAQYPHLICYSVKANSNLSILRLLAELGAGFDVVSMGELKKVIRAGGDCEKTVFSGVGKRTAEIRFALQQKIKCFNVESGSELMRLEKISQELGQQAPLSIRINPNIDVKTHPYIATGLKENKFGVEVDEAINLYRYANKSKYLNPIGIACHIGSQINELEPYLQAITTLTDLMMRLKDMGVELSFFDLGGGKAVSYSGEQVLSISEWTKKLLEAVAIKTGNMQLLIEPGRSIVADAGVLLTRVEYLKTIGSKNFAIVDAAMNDLIRPSLYNATMRVDNINPEASTNEKLKEWEIVGPICESADFLAKKCPLTLSEQSVLAIKDAGAYCFSMASTYNSRLMVAEVMLNNGNAQLIRKRQTYEQLLENEL